jgi:hypothetical protein
MRLGIQAILRYYATSRTSESSPPIGVLTSDRTITLWKIQPKRLRHDGEGSTLLGNWGWARGSGWEVKIWIETANRKLLHCGRSFKFFCERVERNYKSTWPYLCYWSLSICPRKPGWSSFLLDCQEWCPNHTQRTVKVWQCFWPEQCCRACDQPKDPVSSSYEMWICQVTRWRERLNTNVIDTHLVISWRWIIHDYLEWSKMRKVCVCTSIQCALSGYCFNLWSWVSFLHPTSVIIREYLEAREPLPPLHQHHKNKYPPLSWFYWTTPRKNFSMLHKTCLLRWHLGTSNKFTDMYLVMYFTCEQGPQHLLVATLQRHQE